MTMTIYDPQKGCFILNPKEFKTTINAFHPDYVKTYMPTFLASLRTTSVKEEAGKSVSEFVTKKRETKPSHGTLFGISNKETSVKPARSWKQGQAMTMAEIHNDLADKLKIKDFHIYAKAGMPKGKKK